MSLTGVYRFVAPWAKLRNILVLLAASSVLFGAAACPEPAPKSGNTVASFKDLDRRAETAIRQRRPTVAIRLYERAICLFPDSPRGFYGLGVAQLAAQDFTDARVSFRTADRLQSMSPMPLIMEVRANFSLGDRKALKANLRDVSTRFPNDEQAHTVLARFLAGKKLFILALAEAIRAEKASGGSPASKVQLAVLENIAGAYDDSIDNAISVEQARALPNEMRAAAAGIAGLSYESLGEPEQATQHLKMAITLDASRSNSYLALADLYEQSQKYSDAVEVLEQARLHAGDSPAILLPLGADLIRAGQYASGTKMLHNLLLRDPNIDQAYISLADAARRTAKAGQEVEALQELERHNPRYPMLHFLIAQAMLRDAHPDYSGILRELSLAEESAPSDPDVFYLRGKVLIELTHYREAISNLSRAAELRPMDVSTYYQLARLYQKLGNSEMAAKQFRKVKYIESAAKK